MLVKFGVEPRWYAVLSVKKGASVEDGGTAALAADH
jgi:hypothetical protein